jgi:hypothetical protein
VTVSVTPSTSNVACTDGLAVGDGRVVVGAGSSEVVVSAAVVGAADVDVDCSTGSGVVRGSVDAPAASVGFGVGVAASASAGDVLASPQPARIKTATAPDTAVLAVTSSP